MACFGVRFHTRRPYCSFRAMMPLQSRRAFLAFCCVLFRYMYVLKTNTPTKMNLTRD